MINAYDEIKGMAVALYDLGGVRAAYLDVRVDKSTLPEGIHAHAVREGDYYLGSVEDAVMVNHSGTIFTTEPLKMLHPDDAVYIYLDDDNEPWYRLDAVDKVTLEDFVRGNYVLRH